MVRYAFANAPYDILLGGRLIEFVSIQFSMLLGIVAALDLVKG